MSNYARVTIIQAGNGVNHITAVGMDGAHITLKLPESVVIGVGDILTLEFEGNAAHLKGVQVEGYANAPDFMISSKFGHPFFPDSSPNRSYALDLDKHNVQISNHIFKIGERLPNGNVLGQKNRTCQKCNEHGLHWESRFTSKHSANRWYLFDANGVLHYCHNTKWESDHGRPQPNWQSFYVYPTAEPTIQIINFDFCSVCRSEYDISHSCKCEKINETDPNLD